MSSLTVSLVLMELLNLFLLVLASLELEADNLEWVNAMEPLQLIMQMLQPYS